MTIETIANYTLADWQAAAKCVLDRTDTRLYIDGRYIDAIDGGRFDTINPATGETLKSVSAAGVNDVDQAVKVARKAFRSGTWSRMAPRERMHVLYRFAELIDADAEHLAVLDTLDMGKPISDMVNVDLPSVISWAS